MINNSWRAQLADLRAGVVDEVRGALRHPALNTTIDVKWGEVGDPARDYRTGYGLAHILAKHPEMEEAADRLPAIIAGMDVKQRRPERLILHSATHEASIALTWHGADQCWLVTAYEKKTPVGPTSVREPIDGGSGSPRPEAG